MDKEVIDQVKDNEVVQQQDDIKEQEVVEDDDPNEIAEQEQTKTCTTRYGRTIRQPMMFEPRMTGRYHETVHLQHTDNTVVEEYCTTMAQIAVNFVEVYRQQYQTKHLQETSNLVLHDRECFKPIDVKSLSPNERKKEMESLIFLLEKKVSKKVKWRHCANT